MPELTYWSSWLRLEVVSLVACFAAASAMLKHGKPFDECGYTADIFEVFCAFREHQHLAPGPLFQLP